MPKLDVHQLSFRDIYVNWCKICINDHPLSKMHPTLELVHAHQSFPVENLLWDDLGGGQELETFICWPIEKRCKKMTQKSDCKICFCTNSHLSYIKPTISIISDCNVKIHKTQITICYHSRSYLIARIYKNTNTNNVISVIHIWLPGWTDGQGEDEGGLFNHNWESGGQKCIRICMFVLVIVYLCFVFVFRSDS